MKVIMCALRGRGGRSGERDSWHLRLEIGEKDVSNTIDTVQKDFLLMEIYDETDREPASPEKGVRQPAGGQGVLRAGLLPDNKERQQILDIG